MRRLKPVKSKVFKPSVPRLIIISRPSFIWFIVLLLTLALVSWVMFSGTFTIKRFLCREGERPCSSAVEAELNQLKNKNILFFRADELETKLQKATLVASTVSVKVKLPHTIEVVLSLKKPAIIMAEATDSAALLVDGLTPFEVTSLSEPIQILSPKVGNLRLGEPITEPSLVGAINLHHSLVENFIPFKYIQALDDRLEVILKDGTMAIFAVDSDFSGVTASLQLILSKATIGQKPKQIDLRFNKPVLRF